MLKYAAEPPVDSVAPVAVEPGPPAAGVAPCPLLAVGTLVARNASASAAMQLGDRYVASR